MIRSGEHALWEAAMVAGFRRARFRELTIHLEERARLAAMRFSGLGVSSTQAARNLRELARAQRVSMYRAAFAPSRLDTRAAIRDVLS